MPAGKAGFKFADLIGHELTILFLVSLFMQYDRHWLGRVFAAFCCCFGIVSGQGRDRWASKSRLQN